MAVGHREAASVRAAVVSAPAPIAPAAPLGKRPALEQLSGKQCVAATRRRAKKLDGIVRSDRILSEEHTFFEQSTLPDFPLRIAAQARPIFRRRLC
jgi:hypothetical protein